MSYTPKNNFNLQMIKTTDEISVYIPENNSNLQLGRTGIGEKGFMKKLLADVACCNKVAYQFYGGFQPIPSQDLSREFTLHGGCPNFSWDIGGSYFSFTNAITSGRTNTINADASTPPGTEGIATITDACGDKISIRVVYIGLICGIRTIGFTYFLSCIADASMAWDYGTSAETIVRNNSCTVAIIGNNKPFLWNVSGTGFTLDNATTTGLTNTLNADGTACGPATITVTGCDGTVVIGYVRCTEGQWGAAIDGCILSGVPDTIEAGTYAQILLTKIEGKYKQEQNIGGSHSGTDSCNDFECMAYCVTGHQNCKNCTECLDWACSDRIALGCEPGLDCGSWCCIDTCYDCDFNYHKCQCNWYLAYREWTC